MCFVVLQLLIAGRFVGLSLSMHRYRGNILVQRKIKCIFFGTAVRSTVRRATKRILGVQEGSLPWVGVPISYIQGRSKEDSFTADS